MRCTNDRLDEQLSLAGTADFENGVQGTSRSLLILEWVRAAFVNGVHLCIWYPRPRVLKTA
jgi:hypothetical protein